TARPCGLVVSLDADRLIVDGAPDCGFGAIVFGLEPRRYAFCLRGVVHPVREDFIAGLAGKQAGPVAVRPANPTATAEQRWMERSCVPFLCRRCRKIKINQRRESEVEVAAR